MRTIGKHHHERRTGDATAACDLCGVMWHRSKMRRKHDGLLYCPDDVGEVDKVTLSEAQAENAARVRSDADRQVAAVDTLDGSSLNSVHYRNAGTSDDATIAQSIGSDSFLP